jgi:hypothetical protein
VNEGRRGIEKSVEVRRRDEQEKERETRARETMRSD